VEAQESQEVQSPVHPWHLWWQSGQVSPKKSEIVPNGQVQSSPSLFPTHVKHPTFESQVSHPKSHSF
jgi:hypothetical protein